jgi:hypothetical protein
MNIEKQPAEAMETRNPGIQESRKEVPEVI